MTAKAIAPPRPSPISHHPSLSVPPPSAILCHTGSRVGSSLVSATVNFYFYLSPIAPPARSPRCALNFQYPHRSAQSRSFPPHSIRMHITCTGRGVLHLADGGSIRGSWTNGELAGPVVAVDEDGGTTTGSCTLVPFAVHRIIVSGQHSVSCLI